ncbi:MAG: ATP-binding protein [Bryobacteraceae bacterium]
MFEHFWGNASTAQALERMIAANRIPQTLLLSGPEGVGKATLVRRFAARLLDTQAAGVAGLRPGSAEKIEQDDLSREQNRALIAERERWTGEKRTEDPLFFSTHPDFVTFCPEGPLRQISIPQMRLVRERAQLLPMRGRWRVFLIDQFDRASHQVADALLKTLEEPPPHLILFLTAENPFDLPPTIRSRSVQFHLSPLSDAEMVSFAEFRALNEPARRIALSGGCPGLATAMDLAAYEKRRSALLVLLEAAAGGSFAHWVQRSDALISSKSEKLDLYFKILYGLLEDLLVLMHHGDSVRNQDIAGELERLASRVSFEWLRQAIASADELIGLQRRNVQKGPSLDHMVMTLRGI